MHYTAYTYISIIAVFTDALEGGCKTPLLPTTCSVHIANYPVCIRVQKWAAECEI